jgi:hypothetical protein
MIGQTLVRSTLAMGFLQGVMTLLDRVFTDEVLPHRIYNTVEAAHFLGLERLDVIRLLKNSEIKGRRVDGNYRILGSSILEYLGR